MPIRRHKRLSAAFGPLHSIPLYGGEKKTPREAAVCPCESAAGAFHLAEFRTPFSRADMLHPFWPGFYEFSERPRFIHSSKAERSVMLLYAVFSDFRRRGSPVKDRVLPVPRDLRVRGSGPRGRRSHAVRSSSPPPGVRPPHASGRDPARRRAPGRCALPRRD